MGLKGCLATGAGREVCHAQRLAPAWQGSHRDLDLFGGSPSQCCELGLLPARAAPCASALVLLCPLVPQGAPHTPQLPLVTGFHHPVPLDSYSAASLLTPQYFSCSPSPPTDHDGWHYYNPRFHLNPPSISCFSRGKDGVRAPARPWGWCRVQSQNTLGFLRGPHSCSHGKGPGTSHRPQQEASPFVTQRGEELMMPAGGSWLLLPKPPALGVWSPFPSTPAAGCGNRPMTPRHYFPFQPCKTSVFSALPQKPPSLTHPPSCEAGDGNGGQAVALLQAAVSHLPPSALTGDAGEAI